MRGKKQIKPRIIKPDWRYQSIEVTKMINKIMRHGKRELATRILYQALEKAENVLKKPALEIFLTAVSNVTPKMEVVSRRIGGATYQVPIEVRPVRGQTLAMRWLTAVSQTQKGQPMVKALGEQLIAAFKNEGAAIEKKLSLHKLAEVNRSFAHYGRR